MITTLLLIASILMSRDACEDMSNAGSYDCTGFLFFLEIQGHRVEGLGDMSAEQCLEAYKELEPQTPPFTKVACVQRGVARQEL